MIYREACYLWKNLFWDFLLIVRERVGKTIALNISLVSSDHSWQFLFQDTELNKLSLEEDSVVLSSKVGYEELAFCKRV
jgi:hypothetical protein